MTDVLKTWLPGVAACALLVGILRQLCPPGAVRQIARFTGALLLLCAMLRPLPELPALGEETGAYRQAVEALRAENAARRDDAMAESIAAGLAAYIEDKAETLGLELRAAVTMRRSGGVPLPERVELSGPYDAALSDWIARELGVAKEKQTWNGNG